MAIFTKKELLAVQQPLFRTVDEKGQLLKTSGYYLIVRKESKTSPEVQIDKKDYVDGVAEYNSLFLPGDKIYVYATGYYGVAGSEGDITLQDTITVQKKINESHVKYIQGKIERVRF